MNSNRGSDPAGQRPLRAVSYARISDDARDGAGVQRQGQDTRRLAELHGFELVDTLVDNSISAWSGKARPGYEKLLTMIENDEVDRVLVWHTDRLTRSTRQLVDYLALTKAHGVVTLAVQGSGIDPGSGDGVFLATVLGAVAQQESDHKAERVKRALRQAREAGVPVRSRYRTFGYGHDGVTIVEDEAAFLRSAAEQVLAGASLRSITRQAVDAGLTSTTGGQLTTTGLRRLLIHPKLASLSSVATNGHDRPREVVGTGQWPAILTVEQHEQLLAVLLDASRAVNRQGAEPTHLLTGIATCPCGSAVCASTAPATTKGVRHPIYRCRARLNKLDVPGPHTSRRIADVDGLVTTYVLDMLAELDLSAVLVDDGSDDHLPGLLAERDRLTTTLDSLDDAVAAGRLSPDRYASVAGRVEGQLDELGRQIERAAGEKTPTVAKLVGVDDVAQWWSDADLGTRRALVAELVTVELLPVPKGKKGFHPEYVRVTPRRGHKV